MVARRLAVADGGAVHEGRTSRPLYLAALVDQFQRTPTPQLAAEIRQQGLRFGLTPIDRWRLQWEVIGDAVPTRRPGPGRAVAAPATSVRAR
jgi:hypothetical protein